MDANIFPVGSVCIIPCIEVFVFSYLVRDPILQIGCASRTIADPEVFPRSLRFLLNKSEYFLLLRDVDIVTPLVIWGHFFVLNS